MAQPFINGVQPSWGSIKVNLLGRTVSGIKKINYSDPQNKEHIRGAGNHPIGRGDGDFDPTAGLEFIEFETRALMDALDEGERLQDIPPFDIVVTFKPKNSPLLRTDIIRNAQFLSNGIDTSQGDTELVHNHDLIISHIDWNV
tara:strand:- start:452 stop:880 length:429 start_codon:yes stop_codon:yes gene_type:complete